MKTSISRLRRRALKIFLQHEAGRRLHKLMNGRKQSYVCPICSYEGPFADVPMPYSMARDSLCPGCLSYERHRLQRLVLWDLLDVADYSSSAVIHFAPEPIMRDYLISIAGTYESADLRMSCVDHRVDLTELPFEDESYDLVYASHVLEHIRNDRKAISEIARIVKRNGIAILPVPVLGEKTIEYDLANPSEDYHVRAPGRDYVDRFKDYFSRVDVFDSSNYDRRYQVYVHEDRSVWPNRYAPNRTPSPGFVHRDYVPVCRK